MDFLSEAATILRIAVLESSPSVASEGAGTHAPTRLRCTRAGGATAQFLALWTEYEGTDGRVALSAPPGGWDMTGVWPIEPPLHLDEGRELCVRACVNEGARAMELCLRVEAAQAHT